MTAQTVEVNDLACGGCGMTTDLCLSMRDDCCVGCTHYPEPIDNDVDEVAVDRAVRGDLSVSLNRQEYAEAFNRLDADGLSAAEIAERLGTTQRTAVRWRNGHSAPISRRPGGRAMDTTVSTTTDELLIKATTHPSKRVQNAAHRAQEAVQKVRDLLAEDAGKAEARQRVARLERELREAKAALRGGSVPTQSTRIFGDGDHKCRKGCGKSSPNPQGRAAHERFCNHVEAVA